MKRTVVPPQLLDELAFLPVKRRFLYKLIQRLSLRVSIPDRVGTGSDQTRERGGKQPNHIRERGGKELDPI